MRITGVDAKEFRRFDAEVSVDCCGFESDDSGSGQ